MIKQELEIHKDLYVDCNGIKTRYWKAGNGEKIVILVHGIGGFIEFWQHQFFALSKDFTVYALDTENQVIETIKVGIEMGGPCHCYSTVFSTGLRVLPETGLMQMTSSRKPSKLYCSLKRI